MLRVVLIVVVPVFLACSKDRQPAPIAPAGKAQSIQAAPSAPQNLRVQALTDTSARVAWSPFGGATGYDCAVKKIGGRWKSWVHQGEDRHSTTLGGLEPATQYRWAVRAKNRDGKSQWAYDNFTTLKASQVEDPQQTEVSSVPPRSGVADPFNIELVFPAKERLGNFEKTVTRQAAAEWEMVILEGLPAEGDIDDIRITVGWLKDDEPLCQNAIACRVDTEARHGSHLPYEGTVYSKFPVKYRRGGVPSLRDTLENRYIMVHEIGHALGLVGSLSTSWRLGLLGDLNDGDPFWAKDSRIVNRPFFGGVLAAVFYDRMVGDLFRGEHVFRGFPMTVLGVPLEGWGKQRGSRVQAVHWAWPELCGAAVSVNHCGEYLPPHGRTEQDFPERFWTGRAVSDLDAAALGDLGYVTKIEGVRQLALNE